MPDDKQSNEENKESLDAKVEEALEVEEEIKEEEKEVEEKVEKVEKEEEVEEVEEEPEIEEKDSYKKRFVESTRESQILHAKNKKTNESLKKAISIKPATEEELMAEYSEWDIMSELEKKLARSAFDNNKKLEVFSEIAEENNNISAWGDKVDKFIDDPENLNKNPKLEGKVDEFRLFANKPTRRGVDFKDLVSAFLYEETSTKKPKQKGKMFSTGTGGAKNKGKKDGKISMTDAAVLKKNDYPKWKQMLADDKFDMDF